MPADRDECIVTAAFARQLERELAAAIKQRDEARRDICDRIAYQMSRLTGVFDPKEVAVNNGWDCFAQQEGGGA